MSAFENIKPVSISWLALMLVLPLGATALAQDSAEENEENIEEIVVTGSNIRGTPIDSPSPVQVLRREDLEAQGTPTVTEIVRNLGISNGNLGETNQFQANAAEGVSSVNIRGLGSERSLVLLNGRRMSYVGYGFGNFINLNSLPSIAIGRLEVLKEGAAATYGSDAVAGVANVLTRSKFTGLEASANLGMIDGSDGDMQLGIIWGGEYAEGGNVVVSLGLQNRTELPVSERSRWSYLPATASNGQGWSGIGNPGTWIGAGSIPCFGSAAACPEALRENPSEFGRAFGTGLAFADPACGEPQLATWSANQGVCRFRYTPFDNLIEDESHQQMFVDWTHSFSDNAHLHVDFLMHDSEVPNWKTSPSYPPQALFGGVQYVFADHPGLVRLAAQTADLDTPPDFGEGGGVFFGRIIGAAGPAEEGARELTTDRLNAVYDFRVGNYDMQVGFTSGNSEGYLLGRDASIHRTGLAFRGLGGPNCPVEVNADGEAVTTAVLRNMPVGTVLYTGVTAPSVAAVLAAVLAGGDANGSDNLAAFRAAAGDRCEYFNPFSNAIPGSSYYDAEQANSQALLNWLVQDLENTRSTSLLQLDYSIQGRLGNFGGGEGSFAAGIQTRENTFELAPNTVSNLNINPCPNPGQTTCPAPTGLFSFLSGANPLNVEQSVTALFFEAALPLQDNLDVQAAIRYEDYGDVNSVDPKVSARWEFINNLTLRASAGTTFRGPVPSQSDANSRITILAFITPASAFKAVDLLGNNNLSPESATTLNLGLVWTPSDTTELVADYWSFSFTDPIQTENQDQLVAAYVAGGAARAAVNDQIFCSAGLCDGAAASGIQRVEANWINGPAIETNGLDLTFRYSADLGAGVLGIGAQQNMVLAYDVDPYIKAGATIAQAVDALGKLNQNNPAPPLPESRMRLTVDFTMNNHKFAVFLNTIGEYEDQRAIVTGDRKTLDAHQTLDFHYNLQFSQEQGTFTASVFNLGDEDPPGAALDLGYDPFTHSAFGQILKLGVRYKFF